MKTKSFLLMAAIFLLSALTALPQGTKFAVQGAFLLQNITGEDPGGDELDYSLAPQFHVGVNVIIPVAPDFYFQPGLQFARKGAKDTEGSETVNFNLCYVELPLNFLYRGQLGNGYVLVGFGPYVAYGVKGKIKSETEEMDIEFKNKVEEGDALTTMYAKPFDAGAGVYAGYETGLGIYFQLHTQLGLLKINPEYEAYPDLKGSMKNVGLGLVAGFRF